MFRRIPFVTIRPIGIGAIITVGLTLSSQGAMACSICRCGDPVFNALGVAGYTTSGYRAALDWERFDKDEGDPADEVESQVENRLTAFLSYSFGERFMVSARVPYSARDLTETAAGAGSESIQTDGLSDPEICAQAMLWSSAMSNLERRSFVALSGGVKTPWGENGVTSNGERIDEHAQPGTGSTDVFGNLSLLYLVNPLSSVFASAGYRHTGTNDYGYRYGSTFLANVSYEHKIGSYADGVLELNFRHADKDRIDSDGLRGDNTGGSLLYVTPKVLFNLTQGVVFRAGAQIPTFADLNGVQDERAVINIGVTYLFLH